MGQYRNGFYTTQKFLFLSSAIMYIPKCTAQILFSFCVACFLQVLILCNWYFIIFPLLCLSHPGMFVFRLQACTVEKQLLPMARLWECDRKPWRFCKVFNCILCMHCCILVVHLFLVAAIRRPIYTTCWGVVVLCFQDNSWMCAVIIFLFSVFFFFSIHVLVGVIPFDCL